MLHVLAGQMKILGGLKLLDEVVFLLIVINQRRKFCMSRDVHVSIEHSRTVLCARVRTF